MLGKNLLNSLRSEYCLEDIELDKHTFFFLSSDNSIIVAEIEVNNALKFL